MSDGGPPHDPTFVVEREGLGADYTVDEIVVLVPQFQPSNLSNHHRQFYDALCDLVILRIQTRLRDFGENIVPARAIDPLYYTNIEEPPHPGPNVTM